MKPVKKVWLIVITVKNDFADTLFCDIDQIPAKDKKWLLKNNGGDIDEGGDLSDELSYYALNVNEYLFDIQETLSFMSCFS
jgi:hypothetical protein